MKKILFGSAAAILAVVGFSSFKSAKHFNSLYYFAVNTDIKVGSGDLIPATGVTYEDFGSSPSITCEPVVNNQDYCWIGVTVNQVTTVDKEHLKANLATAANVQSFLTRTTL